MCLLGAYLDEMVNTKKIESDFVIRFLKFAVSSYDKNDINRDKKFIGK
jgi:hypothetical protein